MITTNTSNIAVHHSNLMQGDSLLYLMDPHTYFIFALVMLPLLVKTISSGPLAYTKVIYILALPTDPYQMIMGRASAELINGANLQGQLGLHVLQSLQDAYIRASHLPVTFTSNILNQYGLSYTNYTVLHQHFTKISQFNELYTHGHFNLASNINSWVSQHSPFLYNIYLYICGGLPSEGFAQYSTYVAFHLSNFGC